MEEDKSIVGVDGNGGGTDVDGDRGGSGVD